MPATAVSELAPVRVRCGFFRDGMADWVGTCRLCGDELWWGDHEGVYA